MANAVYPKFKQSILTEADANNGLNGAGSSAPYVALVDTGTYTYSAAHDFYDDLSGIVGTDQPITSPTVTSGIFDGDDVVFSAVTGASVEALIFYRKNGGANTTWRLVFYEDTGVAGLPVTPNGGDINMGWNASGIFVISDAHRKHGIKPLGKLGKADVYEFSYRGETKRHVGFIAQQVEQFAPEAVREIDGCKRVNYAKAVIMALAA